MSKEMYGMSMTESDMLTQNDLESNYRISGIASILYWTIRRKLDKVQKEYPRSSKCIELNELCNMLDELQKFSERIGE